LRVDTVHQGDREGVKGMYHINAVEEVTQWQVVGATAQISERWLLPVLGAMLRQFPFHIRGFHSDNGSEFINHTVAKLLNKLLVEQTKSRPRHSNDNGLVEAKNGAVIRKHMGYGHIRSAHAEAVQQFYERHFNPYLNFHRPCGVPEIKCNAKGKQRRVYRWYATPWEVLRQLPDLARHLKPGITVAESRSQSDGRKRHRGGSEHARGEAKAVRAVPAEEECVSRTAVEMKGPTAATKRGKVENEKHVSHFPARSSCVSPKTTSKKGDLAAVASRPLPGSFFN
jgi:hypothetical protein